MHSVSGPERQALWDDFPPLAEVESPAYQEWLRRLWNLEREVNEQAKEFAQTMVTAARAQCEQLSRGSTQNVYGAFYTAVVAMEAQRERLAKRAEELMGVLRRQAQEEALTDEERALAEARYATAQVLRAVGLDNYHDERWDDPSARGEEAVWSWRWPTIIEHMHAPGGSDAVEAAGTHCRLIRLWPAETN